MSFPTLVDYVWLGGQLELRSKTRVLYLKTAATLVDIPDWNYDGSSTKQSDVGNSEILLKPRRIFRCPFRPNGLIVMCDTYQRRSGDSEPTPTNHRAESAKVFEQYSNMECWFGIEQEYFITDSTTNYPVGYQDFQEQGPYYCSVGSQRAFCRQLSDAHLNACILAGIDICGTNAEVAPGQWEYQIGIVKDGLDACDQLWISRYILEKLTESFPNLTINWHPKPYSDLNGSGCHVNFSTRHTRASYGIDKIEDIFRILQSNHARDMKVYGLDNHLRMTGQHETSDFTEFTWGYGSRTTSARIGYETEMKAQGYFEDRRPASNMDPYLVLPCLVRATVKANCEN